MIILRKIKTITSRSGEVHFERWAIIETSKFAVYLHKISKPDSDHLHSHPYPFFSMILKGSYIEEFTDSTIEHVITRTKSPLSVGVTPLTRYHKIKSIVCGPVFSIVALVGSFESTEWGYLVNNSSVDNNRYRELKNKSRIGNSKIEDLI